MVEFKGVNVRWKGPITAVITAELRKPHTSMNHYAKRNCSGAERGPSRAVITAELRKPQTSMHHYGKRKTARMPKRAHQCSDHCRAHAYMRIETEKETLIDI